MIVENVNMRTSRALGARWRRVFAVGIMFSMNEIFPLPCQLNVVTVMWLPCNFQLMVSSAIDKVRY